MCGVANDKEIENSGVHLHFVLDVFTANIVRPRCHLILFIPRIFFGPLSTLSCIFGSGHLVVKCLSSRVFSPLPSSFSDTFPPLPASYLREISAIRRNNFQSCWTSPFDCQRILSTSRRLFLQLGSSQDRRATRRRGWPTMNDAWHNLLGISETT